MWGLIVLAGGATLAWALLELRQLPLERFWPVVGALALVRLASGFSLKLPRSSYSFGVADIFIFMTLATLGPVVAVLAAGLEAYTGTRKTSMRLSSWTSSPAAGMLSMALAGHLYLWATAHGTALVPAEVMQMAALCGAALLHYAVSVSLLSGLMAVKRGLPLRPLKWLASAPWMAALMLASAFIAAVVNLNAQRYGPGVIVLAVVLVLVLVSLLRISLRRQEAEIQQRQAMVDAAQREAQLSQERFAAAFTHAAIGMAIVRGDGCVLQVNQALCQLLGRTSTQLLGQPFANFLNEGDAALLSRHAQQPGADGAAGEGRGFSIELRVISGSGRDVWVALHGSTTITLGEGVPCQVYQLHDITSRHTAEQRLQHIAFHDDLTNLANRQCFHERLEVAVERSRLDPQARFAVMFLDLDRFKIVNDSLGHLAGDRLLQTVAERLRSCVRPRDLVARLGGDEFAVLLEEVDSPQTGLQLAQRVLETLNRSLFLNGTELAPGASIGITFSDLGYRSVDEVLRDADLAMYEAKAGGRGRVALFDTSMHERVAEKLALEADLRHAIGEGDLRVHFQPIYALQPLQLTGFEALVRWEHPTRGPISPAVFIALAEEAGHIEVLTDWMLDQALAQLVPWRQLPGYAELSLNVNISARDLDRPDLVEYVQQLLQRHGLPAQALTLEITETTLMGRLETALKTMAELRQLGVGFSIDDFGTGYSSLAYLSTLPIDSLKIDRSFVMGLHQAQSNIEIVRAVLNLARSLGRRVVAEGVETPQQLQTLRELGVGYGQGYLLSRPLPAEQAQALLTLATPALAL